MNISIVSKDNRYVFVKEQLEREGHNCTLCDAEGVCDPDALILSVRKEYSNEELDRIFSRVRKETLVLSPYKAVDFSGNIVDYTKDEEYLRKNAYLTAEGAILLYYQEVKQTLLGKKIVVTGFGRIGKYLCKMLKSQGALVYAYARRDEVKAKIQDSGYQSIELYDIDRILPSAIFNTVPKQILDIKNDEINLVELASSPGGFKNADNVINGGGLPGRFFPISAGEIIIDTIRPYITI